MRDTYRLDKAPDHADVIAVTSHEACCRRLGHEVLGWSTLLFHTDCVV
jgi:hypothetical protein